jgi:hypothetical protein
MKQAWRWFNYVSTWLGMAYLAWEGYVFVYGSIHVGHVLSFREFRELCDGTLFRLTDWLGSRFD